MRSVLLGLPYSRDDTRSFTRSLIILAAGGECQVVLLPEDPYGMPIDDARNFIFESAKKTPEAEFVLFVDNDCIFPMGALRRMLSYDVPYICGGMYTRDFPPRPTIGKYIGHGPDGKIYYSWAHYARKAVAYAKEVHGMDEIPRNDFMFEQTAHDLMEIDGSGMHFALIRRDVIEELEPPWFRMANKSGAGEDFHFCKRAADAGFPLYTDLSIQTGHSAGNRYSFGLRELLLTVKLGGGQIEDDIPPNLVIG